LTEPDRSWTHAILPFTNGWNKINTQLTEKSNHMFTAPTNWSVETMRAAQFDSARGPVRVREVPIPEIDEADALVRVVACGICRSDWHVWNGDWEWFGVKRPLPSVLGHEIGGVVEKVGSSVKRVQPGMRVTIPFHLACGYCPCCRRGEQNLCDNRIFPHSTPGSGGWAQYMRAPNADLNCVPLPEGVDEMAAASLGCRYMTAWRAIQSKGGMRGGEIAAIFGCGGIGLAATEIASTLGVRVIAVDIDEVKLCRARELGASETVNASHAKPEEIGTAIKNLTENGAGVDLALDALGNSATVVAGLYSLRRGGRLSQVGLTSQEDKGNISVPMDMIVCNELQIRGSFGNPQSGYAELFRLVASRRLRPTALVSREVGLEDVDSVLRDMDTFKTLGYVIVTKF